MWICAETISANVLKSTRLNKQHYWRPQEGLPLVGYLSKAKHVILRSLQHHHFQSEINILRKLHGNDDHFEDSQNARKRTNTVKSISNLYKLDPFFAKEGLLRVGGRLKNLISPYKIKYSLIVPKGSHVTVPIILQIITIKACGMTHNAIRQAGYYIINGRSIWSHASSLSVLLVVS